MNCASYWHEGNSPRLAGEDIGTSCWPDRWDNLLKRGEEHQVLPLIYRSLRALEFQGVPVAVQARLKADYRQNVVRNMLFAAELERLLRLLGEAGIRVMPLKGVTLAESLYGDPAMRVCSDIDILVPAADALRARHLILANGYTSPFSEDFFAKHQFHTSADCPLLAERGGLSYFLELHWTLLQHSSKDTEAMEDLWSAARLRDVFGALAFSLTPEWEFIYLATHAAYHKWQTLKWIADINDLCASASINWKLVQAKAERFDLDWTIGHTFAVCAQLYGMPVPPNFPAVQLPAGVPLFPIPLTPLKYGTRRSSRPSSSSGLPKSCAGSRKCSLSPGWPTAWHSPSPSHSTFCTTSCALYGWPTNGQGCFLSAGLSRLRERTELGIGDPNASG